jgi:uncharacterized membrane protein
MNNPDTRGFICLVFLVVALFVVGFGLFCFTQDYTQIVCSQEACDD